MLLPQPDPIERAPGAVTPRRPTNPSHHQLANGRTRRIVGGVASSKLNPHGPTPSLDTNRTNFHIASESDDGDQTEWAAKWGVRRTKSQLLSKRLDKAVDTTGYCRKLGRQLRSCNEFLRSSEGELKAHYSLCRSRWCPVCAHKIRVDRRNELAGIISVRAEEWAKSKDRRKKKARLGLLTLTVRAAADLSCRQSFQRLHKAWGRLTKTREWKALNDAGWAGAWTREVEFNEKGGWYHFHQHQICEIPETETMSSLRELLRTVWLRVGGGPIMDLRVVENEAEAIQEVSKYITKDLTKSADQLATIINAVRGQRMFQVFGKSWKAARKEAKNLRTKLLEEAETPEAPSPINEKTGQVAELPNGDYSLAELVLLARNGCWSALYALDWFRWYVFTSGQRYYSQLVYDHLSNALASGLTYEGESGKTPKKLATGWVENAL